MDVYVGNDNVITLTGLQNVNTGAYITGATVTGQLKTWAGTNVGTSITLSYVAASDGDYRGTIEEDVSITAGKAYWLYVDVDAGSDLKAHWELPLSAVRRSN
jgi:hypothetical protein